MAVERRRGIIQASKYQQTSIVRPFIESRRHTTPERCLWFSREKRAKVNRKKLCFWFCGWKKAADHQISIQFEFVYSVVMTYNGILIEFCCYKNSPRRGWRRLFVAKRCERKRELIKKEIKRRKNIFTVNWNDCKLVKQKNCVIRIKVSKLWVFLRRQFKFHFRNCFWLFFIRKTTQRKRFSAIMLKWTRRGFIRAIKNLLKDRKAKHQRRGEQMETARASCFVQTAIAFKAVNVRISFLLIARVFSIVHFSFNLRCALVNFPLVRTWKPFNDRTWFFSEREMFCVNKRVEFLFRAI